MSANLARRLREDRALRNTALALLKADIDNLRADLTGKSLGSRLMDRMSEGASDVFDEAVEVADNNRGVLAALVAAVVLWFARNPIMSLFGNDNDADADAETGEEPNDA